MFLQLDLTSVFDTLWRKGLIYKLLRIIPCQTTARLLQNMLSNRCFKVILCEKISNTKAIDNLPQGLVLASILLNLYISDLPITEGEKFCYSVDITLATRYRSLNSSEAIFMAVLGKSPFSCKDVCCTVHSHN